MVTIQANFRPHRSARRVARLNRLLMVILGAAMAFTLVSFGLVVQVKSFIQTEQSQAKTMAEMNNNLWIEQHRATSFEKMMESREAFKDLAEPTAVLTVNQVSSPQVKIKRPTDNEHYPTSFGY